MHRSFHNNIASTPARCRHIFKQVTKRLQRELDGTEYRRFAYAVLDEDRAADFLAGAPKTPGLPSAGFPSKCAGLVVIMSWCDEKNGWLLAGINARCEEVIAATKELGDVLGFLAPELAGEPNRLSEALRWLRSQPELVQNAHLHPLLARSLANAALNATEFMTSKTMH